jgi:predicted Zn-dependent protease
MVQHRLLLAGLVLVTVVAGCSVNPVTGKRELSLLSESQAKELGAESDQAIVSQYGLYDNRELAAYVNEIGQKMTRVSHRPDLAFTFRLLDDSVVNAFALPGGYVYITRGILAYLSDEAALAGVIGHEIGHVTARHGAQRYTQQQLMGLGLGIGSMVNETFAEYAGALGTAGQLLLLKYGRDDERQSDQLGVEYATKVGYDTRTMAEFFNTLDQLSGGSGRLPGWASTHPDPGERYQTVLGLTEEWKAQVGSMDYQENRDRFLRQIDGIPFGRNPREGFVRDGVFLHPDLAFRFPVPSGWQVANGKTQVQVVDPDGQAAVLFSLAGEPSAAAAADAFASGSNITVTDRRTLQVNGLVATRIETQVAQEDGTLAVLSTFIEKDGSVFVFHGLTQPASFDGLRGTFLQVADGFARLTDASVLNVQPITLRVVEAPRDGTFAQVVRDWPIPDTAEIDVAGLALMNGVEPSTPIRSGHSLKVLVP